MPFASPRNWSPRMTHQLKSISYQARPCRAEVGCAWWLLCQPSPKVKSATHQLLVESSLVANLRLPHMCVAELTSQVACRLKTMRKKMPHINTDQPPKAKSSSPQATIGT